MKYPDEQKMAQAMRYLDSLFPDHDIAIVVADPATDLSSAMINHLDIDRIELARHLAEGALAGHITVGN